MQDDLRESKPWISVIIPAHNAEPWLKDAIDSALKCSARPLEIIVVDDGSTDCTYKIASMYAQNVSVIRQKNSGVVRARKTGVECARGRYIKLLDSDDLLLPGCMDYLLSFSELYPGEIFLSRVSAFSSSNLRVSEEMYSIGYKPTHLSLVKKEFLLTQATSSGSWLIPRDVYLNYEIFGDDNTSLGEEYEFSLNLVRSNVPIRYIDAVSYLARIHDAPSRLSRTKDEKRHIAQSELIEQAYLYILNCLPSPSSEALSNLACLCWSRGRECIRINCNVAARRYFSLSRKIDNKIVPPGRAFYRTLCVLIGPFASEITLQFIKRRLK